MPDKVRILIREQIITIISTLSALLAGIAKIVLSIICDFGEGDGVGSPPPKDKGGLKKWSGRLADTLKRLAGKAAEALRAIIGSVVGAILSFLGKAVGFVAERTWALTVFVVGLIGWWLMQKVKKDWVSFLFVEIAKLACFVLCPKSALLTFSYAFGEDVGTASSSKGWCFAGDVS